MASSSSSSSSLPRIWKYNVFASFHEPGVLDTFLSHLSKKLNDNETMMFDDQGIEKSHNIAPRVTQAIRESRISIVVLSKNYASSSCCLDELVEILKCKQEMGQIVMTVLYGVDPSHVQNQTGDFWKAFNETEEEEERLQWFISKYEEKREVKRPIWSRVCDVSHEPLEGKEKRRNWRQALNHVVNIAGEHFLNWDNEADMVAKIARDVANNITISFSRDFEDMVGIKAHLTNLQYLFDLDNKDEAMIVGICGPAGVGKTTIARALHSGLSSSFQYTCFMESVSKSYKNLYGSMVRLEEQLLSNFFDEKGMRVYILRTNMKWLRHQKVLIVLDDVDDIQQLKALANETSWFGPGSRILVTTQDKELLQQHGIYNLYRLRVPSDEDALNIFCRYAFRQSNPNNGFEKRAKRVTELCSKLPLSLRLVGSSLHGKKDEEWEEVMRRLETDHDHRQQVLRVQVSKNRCSTGMAFLVVINLLLEIASAVADQLSSIRKPFFSRISLLMSILSLVLSILELTYKIRAHKARFRCKWPISSFYYPSRGYNRIFGSFTDTILLFCVLAQLFVSTITCIFIHRGQDSPINVSVWPLFFAIGTVISKFMNKPAYSEDTLPITKMY